MHLLGGDEPLQAAIEAQAAGIPTPGYGRGRSAELEEEVRRLREELDALKAEFADFRRQFE
jgi:hypothetical protein